MKRTFTVAEQEEMDFPWNAVEREPIETTRWGVVYEAVFYHDGKYWQTTYERGATEMQDDDPYKQDLEATEVERKEVTVSKYVPVEG